MLRQLFLVAALFILHVIIAEEMLAVDFHEKSANVWIAFGILAIKLETVFLASNKHRNCFTRTGHS